jgi:hypothetical protein
MLASVLQTIMFLPRLMSSYAAARCAVFVRAAFLATARFSHALTARTIHRSPHHIASIHFYRHNYATIVVDIVIVLMY